MRVRKSPKLKLVTISASKVTIEFPPERKRIPIKTTATPIKGPVLGFFFSKNSCRKGIITTADPVKNADFVADVCLSPTVCAANPRNRSTPKIIGGIILAFFQSNLRLITIGKRIMPAIKKRSPINNIEEISSRAPLIITNVALQSKVTISRLTSPL